MSLLMSVNSMLLVHLLKMDCSACTHTLDTMSIYIYVNVVTTLLCTFVT